MNPFDDLTLTAAYREQIGRLTGEIISRPNHLTVEMRARTASTELFAYPANPLDPIQDASGNFYFMPGYDPLP